MQNNMFKVYGVLCPNCGTPLGSQWEWSDDSPFNTHSPVCEGCGLSAESNEFADDQQLVIMRARLMDMIQRIEGHEQEVQNWEHWARALFHEQLNVKVGENMSHREMRNRFSEALGDAAEDFNQQRERHYSQHDIVLKFWRLWYGSDRPDELLPGDEELLGDIVDGVENLLHHYGVVRSRVQLMRELYDLCASLHSRVEDWEDLS